MEVFVELFFELILDGCIEFVTDSRTPKPVRVILLLILGIVYGGLITLFVILGIDFWKDGSVAGAICMFILAAVLLILLVAGLLYKNKKSRRKEEEEKDGSFT